MAHAQAPQTHAVRCISATAAPVIIAACHPVSSTRDHVTTGDDDPNRHWDEAAPYNRLPRHVAETLMTDGAVGGLGLL
jgi:hypothetical protein